MTRIRYEVAGTEVVEEIHPDLADFYRGRHGYTVVVDETDAAELKGDDLLEAARQAGVHAPTTLTADEKRAAIVAATGGEQDPPHPPPPDLTEAEKAAADADPSRPAADTEE